MDHAPVANAGAVSAAGTTTTEGERLMAKESMADQIMPAAKMKPLLALSKREPVQAAVGLTSDGEGVVLMDKKLKPKKCLAMLKALAAKEKIQLQPSTLRFGKAEVDTDYDPGMVRFFVNKEAPGNMRAKLVVVFKQIAYSKVEFNVDPTFEEELDEDPEALTTLLNQLKAQIPLVANGDAKVQTPLDALAAAAQTSLTGNDLEKAAEGIDALRKALAAVPRPVAEAPLAPSPPQAPTLDAGKLTAALAQLVQAIPKVAGTNRDVMTALAALAAAPQASLKANPPDLAKASEGIEALRHALADAQRTAGAAADAAKLAAAGPGPVAYAKSRLAWLAARKKMETDIDALRAKIVETFKEDAIAPQIETNYRTKVAPVLAKLDETLADTLDAAASAPNPVARAERVAEAKAKMGEYAKYLATEPLFKDLDENPFLPLTIRATIGGTIQQLSRIVT
jgi:hypothetical protein